MKKTIFLLMAIFFLSGCSSALKKAETQYQQGNYLQSVEIMADFLDNERNVANQPDANKMFVMIDNIVNHYERQINTTAIADYNARIVAYDSLLFIRKRLSDRPYNVYIRGFTEKYTVNELNQTLAKLYYDKGTAISDVDKYSYKDKADAFAAGMRYYPYKNIEQLFTLNDKKYRTMFAEDYFKTAQTYAKNKMYQDAAEQFNNAADIYRKYGNYKDSEALAARYDQMYRKAETERLYNDAMRLSQTAKTHAEYRKVAKVFYDAYLVYHSYGQINDARTLYERYAEKGQIKLYVDTDRYFERLIKDKLAAEYITFVNTASAANVTMRIQQDFSYYQDKDRSSEQKLSEKVKEGTERRTLPNGSTVSEDVYKTYHFISHTTESRNQAKLKIQLITSGSLFYKASYNIEQSSECALVTYSGDVPKGYKKHIKGNCLTEEKLRDKIMDAVWNDLVNDIRQIARELETV